MERPRVLVVAGYDPSGGAGVLADVKTLEAHGVYGYAACTALTYQHEREIRRIDWLPEKDVFEQIDVCFDSAKFDWVKIGITPSLDAAGRIIGHIRELNPAVRVVLDPVIKATSGMVFWEGFREWEAVAEQCYVVTPNWEEINWLYADGEVEERCRGLRCNVYLKGPGRDHLWMGGRVEVLEPVEGMEVYPKHGSGCVLASSLAANLALGYALPEAAARAKRYTAEFLTSNRGLLGWHRYPDFIL